MVQRALSGNRLLCRITRTSRYYYFPNIMKSLILSIVCLAGTVSLFGQDPKPTAKTSEQFESGFVATQTGGLIVYSGLNHSFTIEVQAKVVKPTEQTNFYLVDNQIVQTAILPIPMKTDLKDMSTIKQKEIIRGYIDYELLYFRNTLKQEYSKLHIDWTVINGKVYADWSFDMPKDNQQVKKQLYMTTICFDQILDLNAPVFDNYTKAKEILLQLAGSIKLYNNHLNLTAMVNPPAAPTQ